LGSIGFDSEKVSSEVQVNQMLPFVLITFVTHSTAANVGPS